MTRNLSRGGLFAVTKRPVAKDTLVGVEFLYQNRKLRGQARVANCAADGLGLEFVDVSDEFKAAIRSLMDTVFLQHTGDTAEFTPPTDVGPVSVFWSQVPDGKWWKPWQRARHRVEIANLTHDGAAVLSRNQPRVGDTVVFFLEGPSVEPGGRVSCRAEVVRHTETGFAVRFVEAQIEFRRTVSLFRRSKFSPR